jgi:outer membrane protein TolC
MKKKTTTTPLQRARKALSEATKKYKDGKATLTDVQKAATRISELSCKVKSKK